MFSIERLDFFDKFIGIFEDNEGLHDEGKSILMQFTGLKDKNGKEIYEGDLVRSGNGRIWEVKFGEFVYSMPDQEYSGYGYYICPNEKEYQKKGNWYLYQSVEVIGNIHENPELLEESK